MPLKVDIQNALDNEALHDVSLIGSDEIPVPCNKFVLAMRSPVFMKMFFGEHQARHDSDSVKLDYPSSVLKALVKYCYSDEIDLDLIDHEDSMTDDNVSLLLDLRDAANQFEFSCIADNIFGAIGNSIFQDGEKSCVCAVLSSLSKRGESGSRFWNLLFALATNEPEACLLPTASFNQSNKGIKAVQRSLLTQILEKLDDPYILACCLKEWHAENPSNASEEILLTFANATDLNSIPTQKLATLKPCALYSSDRLHEALSFRIQNYFQQEDKVIREAAILVSGTGMESVDGYYSKTDQFMFGQAYCFKKKGTFGSQDSEYTLELINGRWTITVGSTGFSGSKILYEAPIGSLLSFAPNPTSMWTCVEGPSPAPYVVEMEHKKPNPVFQGFSNCSAASAVGNGATQWGENQFAVFRVPGVGQQQQQPSSFGGFSIPNHAAAKQGQDFRPTQAREKNGDIINLMTVSAMSECQGLSLEELRLEHYRRS